MRLAGWDVPEPQTGTVAPDAESGVVPETVSAGTPAWQRAQQMAAAQKKRARGHHA